MGVYAGPDVVEDGLVLSLDAGNTKSYPGYWSPTLSNGANAFDGSLSTAAGILGGTTGPFTYTFANPPAINSARMFVTFGAGSNQVGGATNIFLVNGIDVTQKAKDANVFGDGVGSAWIDVTTEAGSNWNTFQFRTISGVTNAGIYAIEINGKIIVGNYNGTTWTDLSGNGNNGTLTNGVGFDGGNGGSLSFDGVDDYVTLGTPSLMNGVQVPLTICVWAKANALGSYNVLWGVDKSTTGGGLYSMLRVDFGQIRYFTTNYLGGIQVNGNVFSVSTGVWNFYAVTVSGTISSPSVTIYLNNSSSTLSYSTLSSSPDLTVDFRIGSNQRAGEDWNGNISNVMWYNRALTASEIQQNFNATRGRFGL